MTAGGGPTLNSAKAGRLIRYYGRRVKGYEESFEFSGDPETIRTI